MEDSKLQSLERIILKMQPFSDDILAWCSLYEDFALALKVIYPDRFITLQAIVVSFPTHMPDKVLGVFAYDYDADKFKQDFIVDLNSASREFVLYTSLPKDARLKYGKYVKHIKEFFSVYGTDGQYANTHHPTFEQLPKEIQPRAQKVLELALKLKASGRRTLSEEELLRAEVQVDSYRNGRS